MGLLLVAFAPHHLFAVAGIALWVIGSALGFPLGISALSVDPVMTPARVSVLSTVNYGAALIGPPLLGLIADHIGYHRALAFVALPILLASCLPGRCPTGVEPGARTWCLATRQAAYPACPRAFLRRLGRCILVGRNACDVALSVASMREEESWRE